jgi:hypothetical protein
MGNLLYEAFIFAPSGLKHNGYYIRLEFQPLSLVYTVGESL